jgi:hypothetical protein
MRYDEMKRLNKNQLINVINENQNRLNNTPNTIITNESNENNVQNLQDIFPFEKSIFSECKRFKTVTKQTIYENKSHKQSKELDIFLKKIKWQVLSDIDDVNVKISFHLKIQLIHPLSNQIIYYGILTKTKTLLIEDDKEEFYQVACKDMKEKTEKIGIKGNKIWILFFKAKAFNNDTKCL